MKNYGLGQDLGEYFLIREIGDEPCFNEEWEYKIKTEKFSCIYAIRNIVNNKLYIGSAKEFKNRKRIHKQQLKNNNHHPLFSEKF